MPDDTTSGQILAIWGRLVTATFSFGRCAYVSDPSLASPGAVAWRTRHLVGFLLVSGLALVGLTLMASQTDPTAAFRKYQAL